MWGWGVREDSCVSKDRNDGACTMSGTVSGECY